MAKRAKRQPIRLMETTTNLKFKSVNSAAKTFNITEIAIKTVLDKNNHVNGLRFRRLTEEEGRIFDNKIVEVYSGKMFDTVAEVRKYYNINTNVYYNAKKYDPHTLNNSTDYYFETWIYEDIEKMYDKLIKIKETEEIMTIKMASKAFKLSPFLINKLAKECNHTYIDERCITFLIVTDSDLNKEDEDNEEDINTIDYEQTEENNKELISEIKPIFNFENFEILFNKEGDLILIKDDTVLKRFTDVKTFLEYFNKRNITVDLENDIISELIV